MLNTGEILCDLSHSTFNEDESVNQTSEATWSCNEETRLLVANGIPDHEVGTFPNMNNPNQISAQNVEINFPLSPAIVHTEGMAQQVVAYALNGVKIEVGTAGTCNQDSECNAIGNGGQWRMEAVGENSFDFGNDENHGHVQPFGAYHYHGIPENYLTQVGRGESMTMIGWAVDGFPIYARYGHEDRSDLASDIKILTTSWQLKSQVDTGRPSTDIYPLGAFTQDFEYISDSGDLDECNGLFGVTPEFPGGIYHYYLTDQFPYGQRCIKGTSLSGMGGMGPEMGGMGPEMGGMMPGTDPISCSEVPPGAPCCGDDFCGGPETADNCPSDCR